LDYIMLCIDVAHVVKLGTIFSGDENCNN